MTNFYTALTFHEERRGEGGRRSGTRKIVHKKNNPVVHALQEVVNAWPPSEATSQRRGAELVG